MAAPKKSHTKRSAKKPTFKQRSIAAWQVVRPKLGRFLGILAALPLGYWLLAIIWGYIAVRSYLDLTTPFDFRVISAEPHPVVGAHENYAFSEALRAAAIPVLFGALCLLTLFVIRARRWRRVVLGTQLIVIAGLFLWMTATQIWTTAAMQSPPAAHSLDQTIVQRAQCGDAVRIVDDYSLGAQTFYELKDRGYSLAATYDTPTGMLDSDEACTLYYDIRSQHRAEDIVLQIFTYDEQGTPGPYLYKYAGQPNVAYGIFVRSQ